MDHIVARSHDDGSDIGQHGLTPNAHDHGLACDVG